MPFEIHKKYLNETIKEVIIDGLLTDGAHHKQWFLEQIALKLGFDLSEIRKELLAEDYDWDDGIIP